MKNILSFIFFLLLSSNFYSQEILWTNSIKGTGEVYPVRSIVDSYSNIYVFGRFDNSITAPVNLTSNGLKDLFLSKFDKFGNLLWIRQMGSDLTEQANGLTIDNLGNVYIAGRFQNTCSFGTTSITSTGGVDIFVAKYSSEGDLSWVKPVATGTTFQGAQNLAIDKDGNLVLIGIFQTSIDFQGVSLTESSGINTNFIAKFDLNANLIWAKKIVNKNSNGLFYGISCSNDGYYFSASLIDTIYLDIKRVGSKKNSLNNYTYDILLYKTDYNGNGIWFNKIEGSGEDANISTEVDNNGNVYVAGYFNSSDLSVDSIPPNQELPSIKSKINSSSKGSYDVIFAKFSSLGILQWYDAKGGIGDERLARLNSNGKNIVFSGQFGSQLTLNNTTLNPIGGLDALGVIHDENDNLLYAVSAGGTGTDIAQTCVIDNDGNYIFIGDFTSPTIKFDNNNSLTNPDPGKDMFIAKYKSRSISFVLDTVKCFGTATGSIVANPKGAWVGDLTFSWTKDGDALFTASTQSINNITAGTYRCTVSSGLYSETAAVTMVEPAALTASENMTSHKNAVCYGSADGALALTVSGGTGTKSYVWSGNGTGVIANNVSQNAISAGTYSAAVTDKKGCSVTVNNMVVTEPPKIHFKGTSVTPINGTSGKVNLVVNGAVIPFTAAWTGAGTFTQVNEDIEGISVAGNYSVLVTDNNNCKADTTVLIVDSNNLYAFVSEKKNVSCNGGNDGSITVTPQTNNTNPSFSYAWTGPGGPYPSQPTITGVAGTYSVIVTDNNESPVKTYTISDITITGPAAALEATITPGNVTCFGLANGFADANGTGGTLPYTYQWKKNGESLTEVAEVITSLGAGNYDVTITDALNCTATASSTLTAPSPITVNSAVVTPVTCNGTKNDGVIALNVSGGTGTLTYRWSNGLTGQTISLLSAGTYRCTITDINNCSEVTQQTVGQPSIITASFTNTNVSCYAGSNGVIDLTPAGGNAGAYTFKWSNNQVTEDISGLSVGSYSVTVVDSKKCEKSFTTSLTQPLAALDVTAATVTNANCNGSATGSITLNTTGGTSPYLWSWSNNQTGSAVSNLVAGSYTVTVTDSKNCTKDASFTVTEPTALTISEVIASHTNVLCNGAGTGALEISASGSTGTYEYSLSGVTWQSSPVFSNLASGDYNVMVRDQSVTSCQKTITAPVVITQPAAIAFTSPSAANITCNGLANGTISTAATGGTGSLLYKLILDGTETSNVSGASTGLFTGLASGANYTVEVADANNCKLTSNTFSISEPQAITLASAAATDITCPGLTNGAVNAQALGGTGALVYKLLLNDAETGNISGASSGSFADLSEGTTYKVQVTDANNCGPVSSQVLSVAAPQPVSLSNLTANNITCAGLTNGSISIQASGGNGSYSYKLLLNNTPGANVTGATTGNFTGLSAGTGYSIEVTDGNNCGPVVSNAVNILEPAQISIVSQTASRASGSGASDGGINIIASGGTGNLSFVLNTGITQTSGTFTSLTVGTYQVTITDANNCGPVSSSSLIVESPTSIDNLNGTKIRLYPNPVSERVFVEVKNQEFKELKVELKNISGHASLTQKYENVGDGFVADIDLSRLPKGIYVIVVNNNVTKDKLIVQ